MAESVQMAGTAGKSGGTEAPPASGCGTADELYASCRQCPRNCGVNRAEGKKGLCGEDARLRAASACLHFGEEPLLTVFGGSGTIFFTGCTLRCSFCQNYQISQQGMGREITADEFASICLRLQEAGAENINLVTGSHHSCVKIGCSLPLKGTFVGKVQVHHLGDGIFLVKIQGIHIVLVKIGDP